MWELVESLPPIAMLVCSQDFKSRAPRMGKTAYTGACIDRLHADTENLCALKCYQLDACVTFYYRNPASKE